MKGIVILADYFEDAEMIMTIDLLNRANIKTDLVSITGSTLLKTQSGVTIKATKTIDDIELDDYDFVFLPGGMAVSKTHLKSEITQGILLHFYLKNQLIALICAAPSVLGDMGLLKDTKYTCFPGFEKYCTDGVHLDEQVVTSSNIITAKALGAVIPFSYEIIKYLKDEDTAKKVLNSIYY